MAKNSATHLLANILGSLVFMTTVLVMGVGIVTLVSTWQSKEAKFVHSDGTVELVETRWWGLLQNYFEPGVERFAYDAAARQWSRIDAQGSPVPLAQSIAVDLR